jgi:hypothetical protein
LIGFDFMLSPYYRQLRLVHIVQWVAFFSFVATSGVAGSLMVRPALLVLLLNLSASRYTGAITG